MKRSFSFFTLILLVCGIFYFQKTKTEKENHTIVQGVVQMKEDSESKVQNILDMKKECSKRLDELKSDIDKINENISSNIKKLKITQSKRNADVLRKKNEELKREISNYNTEIDSLNSKVDVISNLETIINDWRQKVFEILAKTQTGKLSNECKVKLNAISEEYKNLMKDYEEKISVKKDTKTIKDVKSGSATTTEKKEEVKTDTSSK